MKSSHLTIGILLLIIVGLIGYLITMDSTEPTLVEPMETTGEPATTEPDEAIETDTETLPEPEAARGPESVIGNSADGFDITAYHYGDGDTEILFVSGVHGGYSWSTAALGYELVDYFDANPNAVPENITLTIVPVMNPDGLNQAVGTIGRFSATLADMVSFEDRVAARFNGNEVDLNRNFACDWSSTGTWQNREVSGGSASFSEPESAAIRDYINEYNPDAAIVWFASEGRVYPSACESEPSDASIALANTFAAAANYPTAAEFDAYAITGDMVNWMAAQNIPAISVLLSSHDDTEFTKNLAGVEAILSAYSN
jgi:hypothetical protein